MTASRRPQTLNRTHLLGLALCSALVPLNSTMIAVALPDLAADFGIAAGSAASLVTIYLVVMLFGQPTMGRVIDAVGGRRVLNVALVGFAAASIATAFASTFALVVLGRATQAVFGAALMPAAQALLRTLTVAERRGRAFGLLGSFIGAGAAIGPVIGGVVIQFSGWQGIFVINVPVIAVALMSIRGLPTPDTVAGARVERSPSLARLLLQRTFGAAFVTQAATTLAQYSMLLVIPIVLDGQGWSSAQIGVALTALTAGMVLMGPVGGRVGDVRGRRRPVVIGVGAAALGAIAAAVVVESSAVALVGAMAVFGFGMGFAIPSVQTAALESVPEEFAGSASGVLSMSRYTGSIPASVLLAVLVADGGEGAGGYLGLGALAMAIAVLAATRLPTTVDSDTDAPSSVPPQ